MPETANTTIDIFNITHPSNVVLSVVLGTIGAIGVPSNLSLMILIMSKYKVRKPHEWLLFTLALGDFLLCVNSSVLEAYYITHFHEFGCKVAGAIDYTFGNLSLYTPTLVAYNRYVSLYDSTRYKKIFTNRNVFLAWGAVVLSNVVWMTPFAITGSLGQDDLGLCGIQIKSVLLSCLMFFDIFMINVSYFFLVYFAFKVINKVRKHKKQANEQSQIQSRLMNESQDIIKAMLIISTIPLFAQMPAVVVKMLDIFLPPFDPWISRSSIAPFPLTSASNAFITVFVVKDYRAAVKKLFKKSTSNSVAPQLQAGSGNMRTNPDT